MEKYLYVVRKKKIIKKNKNIYKIGKVVGIELNHISRYSKGEIN